MQRYLYMPKLQFLTFVAVQFSCYSEDLTCPITCYRAPTIIEGPPQTIYYNSGSRLTLYCRASGYPVPKLLWYVNDIQLTQKELQIDSHQIKQSNYSSILMLNTKPFDEFNKIYCKALNEEGLAMSNVSILTQAVLKEEQLHKSTYNVTVTYGRSLILQCGHIISVPPPSYSWFLVDPQSLKPNLNVQPVQYDEQVTTNGKGSLIFTSISKSDTSYEHVFKCQAYNYILRKTSAGSYFRILVVPGDFSHYQAPDLLFTSSSINSVVGENITLMCIFSGLPQPKIVWSKENKKLTNHLENDHGRRIIIANVSLVDAGIYKCSARNIHGESHSFISIEVGAPPTLLSKMADHVGNLGTSVVFVCNCSGIPSPKYEWYVNTQNIKDSNLPWSQKDNVLVLINVQMVLRATITCNASNLYGYILVYAQATVQGYIVESENSVPQEKNFLLTSSAVGDNRKLTSFFETSDNDSRLIQEIYSNGNFTGYYAHSQEQPKFSTYSFSVFNIIWLSLFILFLVFVVIFIYYKSKNRLFTYQVTKVTLRCQGTSPPTEFRNQGASANE